MDKRTLAVRPQLMSLDFFANRFLISKENLSWAVEKITTEDDIFYTPVIKILNSQLFIDIKQDILGEIKSVFGKKIELLSATLLEQDTDYHFIAKEKTIILSKQEVEKLYENKFVKPGDLK